MPLYMIRFGYTPETWARLVEHPENREETVRAMLTEAGCELHHLWYAFGEDDGFAVVEAPDTVAGAAVSIRIASTGAFSHFVTTELVTQAETLEALEKAQSISFTAAGAGVHA